MTLRLLIGPVDPSKTAAIVPETVPEAKVLTAKDPSQVQPKANGGSQVTGAKGEENVLLGWRSGIPERHVVLLFVPEGKIGDWDLVSVR